MQEQISELDRRLSIIEERTKPKPKTFVEQIKDWGGVLTFLVALLYTYPLGFWDRFIVTAEQQRAREIDQVRTLAIKLSELDAELQRTVTGIPDPANRTAYAASFNARKAAILAKESELIRKQHRWLTMQENQLLAHHLTLQGDDQLAERLYLAAIEQADAGKNRLFASETHKLLGLFYVSRRQDIALARDQFRQAMEIVLVHAPANGKWPAILTASPWGESELTFGHTGCGLMLAKWAAGETQSFDPGLAQNMQIRIDYLLKSRSQGALATNCNEELVPWAVAGWPWVKTKSARLNRRVDLDA